MEYETIIRNSNTIFSTMICPNCHTSLYFTHYYKHESIGCRCKECNTEFELSCEELCALLNYNGINYIVQSKEYEYGLDNGLVIQK